MARLTKWLRSLVHRATYGHWPEYMTEGWCAWCDDDEDDPIGV